MEEGGPEERQLLELVARDRVLEELMLGGEREELEDELVGIGEEVVVLVDLTRLSGSLRWAWLEVHHSGGNWPKKDLKTKHKHVEVPLK